MEASLKAARAQYAPLKTRLEAAKKGMENADSKIKTKVRENNQ